LASNEGRGGSGGNNSSNSRGGDRGESRGGREFASASNRERESSAGGGGNRERESPAGGDSGGGGNAANLRQLGDPCDDGNQCGDGMRCDGGTCTPLDYATSSTVDNGTNPDGNNYRIAIDVGGGLGLAWLSGKPTYAELGHYDPNANLAEPSAATCGPGNSFICLNQVTAGFAPAMFLYGAIRIRLSRGLAIGAFARYQSDAAKLNMAMPPLVEAEKRKYVMSNLFVGGRLYYAFTDNGWAKNGMTVAAFLGSGFGQMETRPSLAKGKGNTAHVISGLNNAHVGLHIEYGLAGFIHFGFELALNFQFPTFLFVADVLGFAGMHL